MPICGVTYHPLLAESAMSTQLHVVCDRIRRMCPHPIPIRNGVEYVINS
jgi:hypothetical protein